MIAAAHGYSRSWVEPAICLLPLASIFLFAWFDSTVGRTRSTRARQPHMAADLGRVRRVVGIEPTRRALGSSDVRCLDLTDVELRWRPEPLLARPTRLLVPTPPARKPSVDRRENRGALPVEREARSRTPRTSAR